MSNKLDIFDVLKHITMKDTGWLQSLSEEQQKSFQPVVVQQWIKGAQRHPDSHIFGTNEWVNPFVFSLHAHPILLYKCLCVANGFGVPTRYRYLRANKTTKKPLSIQVLQDYYNIGKEKAIDDLSLLSKPSIVAMAKRLGRQKDEVKKIEQEWITSNEARKVKKG